ncbi:prolipoprotein diacylglyceryl transferase [Lacisediminihabitans changchengi]|uniref:Prolipoprotein diacylglyceryl transferase n=1 Tax=Lacisediminihabitans changchengi TaxID=2787634 RepID=A0A934SRI6_9MICO|nr:prolipoprotein diacylglyceryl transferase family protein [Lacisediminihabitans changchengi]MBK4346814.1 prolipoprotein diacylglyceryl transferase [Lacisediminihabitans changchengi]MBK4348063.1 prolipoprotein diacylglyceryl transferase [Lacisediminihabitans changchengi]
MVLPASIPSPNDAWQVFNLGQWFRDLGWTSFGLDINLRASTGFIILGLIIALAVTSRRLTTRGAEPGIVVDVAIWAIPLGIVFGRLVHVALHPDVYFSAGSRAWSWAFVWEGGVSIWGVLLGGLIGVAIGSRLAGLRTSTFLDLAVPGILIGTIGERIGDWFEHDYFGTPTSAPWGVQIPSDDPSFPVGLPDSTIFQPNFLYEIVWALVGLALITAIAKKFELQWGKVFGLYLVWYGLGRSWFESLRIDPSLYLAGLRVNIWIGWGVAIIGLIVLMVASRRHTGTEPSVYVAGREYIPTAEVHSEDTYSDTDEDAMSSAGNDATVDTTDTESVKATRSVTSGAGTK